MTQKSKECFELVSTFALLLASIGKASTCHTERGMTKRWERKVVIMTVLADGLVELEPIPMTAKKHGLILNLSLHVCI